MTGAYDQPLHYEIGFSFRDVSLEVDVLEACARRYAKTPARRFLEIGCGNSPHLPELCRRGYEYAGIDLSDPMLEFSRKKARQSGAAAELVQADMVDFDLDRPVDFAFVMLGSLFIRNTRELSSHFASVARSVRPGGLYLLDWCVHFDPIATQPEVWTCERDGIEVTVEHRPRMLDRLEQTFEERVVLRVNDHGTRVVHEDASVRRMIHPQEFLLFVRTQGNFEFVGWWNDWDLARPLTGEEGEIVRPIALLRRLPAAGSAREEV